MTDSRDFRIQQARDILATWELARDPDIYDRETVLADQIRTLLAIIEDLNI